MAWLTVISGFVTVTVTLVAIVATVDVVAVVVAAEAEEECGTRVAGGLTVSTMDWTCPSFSVLTGSLCNGAVVGLLLLGRAVLLTDVNVTTECELPTVETTMRFFEGW